MAGKQEEGTSNMPNRPMTVFLLLFMKQTNFCGRCSFGSRTSTGEINSWWGWDGGVEDQIENGCTLDGLMGDFSHLGREGVMEKTLRGNGRQ